MDPITGGIITGIISGGASLLGGASANAANARQAAETNLWNWNEQLNAQDFNAREAQKTRDFGALSMQSQYNYNSALQDKQNAQTQRFLDQSEAYNTAAAGVQNQYNIASQQRQMDYETQMSNTAYQRAVRDMKAAGLNPILSAGTGGSSTPSVAAPSAGMASVGTPSGAGASVGLAGGGQASSGIAGATRANMSDVFSPAVSNALQGAQIAMGLSRNFAEIKNVEADTANKLLGPAGSIAGVPIPAVKKILSDAGVGDVISHVGDVVSKLLPPPSPSSAATVSKTIEDITGTPSNALPSGAPKNIPSLVPGALGTAIRKEIQDWLSPPTTSNTPGNPGGGVKSTGRLPSSAQGAVGNLTPDSLYDWAVRTGRTQ